MNTLTFTNVPEGHFTFAEFLELDVFEKAIQMIKVMSHTQEDKLKVLVFTMQYIDVLAAFDKAKNGNVLLGESERNELMAFVDEFVDSNFDEILQRFTEQQRNYLRKAVS